MLLYSGMEYDKIVFENKIKKTIICIIWKVTFNCQKGNPIYIYIYIYTIIQKMSLFVRFVIKCDKFDTRYNKIVFIIFSHS